MCMCNRTSGLRQSKELVNAFKEEIKKEVILSSY